MFQGPLESKSESNVLNMDEISVEESTLLDVSQIEVDSNNNISSPVSCVTPVGLPMSSTPKKTVKMWRLHLHDNEFRQSFAPQTVYTPETESQLH